LAKNTEGAYGSTAKKPESMLLDKAVIAKGMSQDPFPVPSQTDQTIADETRRYLRTMVNTSTSYGGPDPMRDFKPYRTWEGLK